MPPTIPPCPDEETEETFEFTLVGLVQTVEFQRCLAYIETLHKTYPNIYLKPYIRPMLEFDWIEYVTNMQRNIGNNFWHLGKNVVVFVNGEYLGDDDDLLSYVAKRFTVRLQRDYQCLAQRGLLDVYQKYIELGRKFIYISISVNNHVIGHMIFMLYSDFVPKTCKRFIKKCKSRRNGFKGTEIHRIMATSWIQFGDYKIPLKNRSCENYTIPHNRRGVLAMCNDGRNTHNTSQFFVCLNATAWMDYRYVAFGQLVQGDNILKELESKPTYYEHPQPDELIISDCGEITLDDTVKARQIKAIDKYITARDDEGEPLMDRIDFRDSASVLLESHYLVGDYFFEYDNEPHLPMKNLPWQSTVSSSYVSYIEGEGTDHDSHSLLLHEIFYEFPELLYGRDATGGQVDEKKFAIVGEVEDEIKILLEEKIGEDEVIIELKEKTDEDEVNIELHEQEGEDEVKIELKEKTDEDEVKVELKEKTEEDDVKVEPKEKVDEGEVKTEEKQKVDDNLVNNETGGEDAG